MGLCLVTGVSGTGKSAVLGELRRRGCLARGVDEDGYAEWISRRTGAAEVIPRGDPGFDIHAWYRAHDWVLNARRISVLSRAAARCGRPAFLCGSALGEGGVWHLFDRVVALVADVPTIERRIAARAGDYGKAPEELAMIIGWHDGLLAEVRAAGLPVRFINQGQARSLPPGTQLAAYRIVQEALTNVRKHASGATGASVTLRYDAGGIDVEIGDDGQASGGGRGAGHGIAGMRERAVAYGGSIAAGPCPGGGWLVRARLAGESDSSEHDPDRDG